MFADTAPYTFNSGMLFLGHDEGREIGVKTERHAITIAGAGAGKGACVIIPNIKRWVGNLLVIDPKGEAAEETAVTRENMGQSVYVVDPFLSSDVDERFIASYNPLDEINIKSPTLKEDIEAISDGIIMRSDPSASHWDDGAQAIISGLIAYVLLKLPKKERNLVEVRKILRNIDRFDLIAEEMKNLSGCGGLCESGASAIYAKEGGYFVSNAEKNTRWLDSQGMENALTKSTFSLSELKTGNAAIFLVLPANYLGQHGRFLRLFVRCSIEAMARKLPSKKLRDKQCLFLLDEFYSLGFIDEIAKAAGLMRGYGLQLWPILQDLGQLLSLYQREGSETFFANADIHQFFGNSDTTTLEYISARLGTKTLDELPSAPRAPIIQPATQESGLGDLNPFLQAHQQNQMNDYQREMSEHGRPRQTAEQVSKLVRRMNDVVADNMIVFAFGSEALKLKPAPYFRPQVPPKSGNLILLGHDIGETPLELFQGLVLWAIIGIAAVWLLQAVL